MSRRVGLKRARARGDLDRIESEIFCDFFSGLARAIWNWRRKTRVSRTIDATQPLDAVMRDIRATVTKWVQEQRHEMVSMVTARL